MDRYLEKLVAFVHEVLWSDWNMTYPA